MAVPRIINDGNFNLERQVGCDEWRTPFSDKGDNRTFEVDKKYRIDQTRYQRLKEMTKIRTVKGDAYLVNEGEAVGVGSGLVEYVRTFSSVPLRRLEGSTIVYAIQFLSTQAVYNFEDAPAAPEVTELPLTLTAQVVWEYFLSYPELIRAPKVAVVNGSIFTFGGWGTFYYGQTILADDTEIGIYKAGIFYRKSIQVQWPVRPTGGA